MLRQLLQEELKTISQENGDLNSIAANQNKSDDIHMHHGVNGHMGGNVKVTPLVKKAINRVRQLSNHPNSAESRNDVESLMLHERHLRAQFALNPQAVLEMLSDEPATLSESEITTDTILHNEHLTDDDQAQLEAVVEAVEHGTPQPTESFVSRLIQGVRNVMTQIRDYISESVHSISNSMGISAR